jgi:hypothetical protein
MRIHPKCPRHPSIYLSLQPASQPASHRSLPSAVHPFIHACTPETPSSLHFTPRARSGGVDGGAWARSIVASHPSFSPPFSPPLTAPRLASPWTCHHGRGLQERLLCATVRSEKLLLEEHLQLTLDSTPFNSMHSSLAVLRDDATPAGRPGGTMAHGRASSGVGESLLDEQLAGKHIVADEHRHLSPIRRVSRALAGPRCGTSSVLEASRRASQGLRHVHGCRSRRRPPWYRRSLGPLPLPLLRGRFSGRSSPPSAPALPYGWMRP